MDSMCSQHPIFLLAGRNLEQGRIAQRLINHCPSFFAAYAEEWAYVYDPGLRLLPPPYPRLRNGLLPDLGLS
jgi:hypothetical protein